MVGLNKIMIIGNVGKDPEMRFLESGTAVTNFSVAVNYKYGESESTEWFKIVTWQKLAETCNQYVSKGQMVYVEGRLQSTSWEGEDGEARHQNEIVANSVVFLSKKEESNEETSSELEPDDIPF